MIDSLSHSTVVWLVIVKFLFATLKYLIQFLILLRVIGILRKVQRSLLISRLSFGLALIFLFFKINTLLLVELISIKLLIIRIKSYLNLTKIFVIEIPFFSKLSLIVLRWLNLPLLRSLLFPFCIEGVSKILRSRILPSRGEFLLWAPSIILLLLLMRISNISEELFFALKCRWYILLIFLPIITRCLNNF